MPKFIFSIVTLLMFSMLLSACSVSSSENDDADAIGNGVIATTHPDTPTNFNQHGLTSFNDDARNSKENNALPALAVQINKNTETDDTIHTVNRITGAVIDFGYKDNGDFAHTGLTLYFADKKYQIDAGVGDANSINAYSVNSGDADRPKSFKLGISGNEPNYMALADWQVEKDNNTSIGYAITGFETKGSAIPTENTTTFTGNGRGKYYKRNIDIDTNTDFDTSFDIGANVDFTTRNVVLTGTHRNTSRSYLDFTGNLRYATGVNAISGAVITVGTDNNNRGCPS